MDALPDDVVLLVMALLDAGTVLRLRSVCRRLCDLAVHPDVWHHRCLSPDDGRPLSLRKAVLRVAPCLRYLNAYFDPSDWDDDELHGLLRTTNCAAEHLVVRVDYRERALEMTYRQLGLGRVKAVTLELMQPDDEWTPTDSFVVLRVLTFRGLLRLNVVCGEMPPAGTLDRMVPRELISPPSLRELVVDQAARGYFSTAWVGFLLRSHASTLESVLIYSSLSRECDPDFAAPVAAVLSAAPKLRKLLCPSWPAVVAKLSAPELPLTVLSLRGDIGPAVAAALRSAVRLRQLDLEDDDVDGVQGVVEAAASSGRSGLRCIQVAPIQSGGTDRASCEHLEVNLSTLALALPSLRHLASLTLGWKPRPGFFALLNAHTVPHLEKLRVELYFLQCVHAWLHSEGVFTLLEELPALRVIAGQAGWCEQAEPWNPYNAQEGKPEVPCAACQKRCHLPIPSHSNQHCRVSHQRLPGSFNHTIPELGRAYWFEKDEWIKRVELPAVMSGIIVKEYGEGAKY